MVESDSEGSEYEFIADSAGLEPYQFEPRVEEGDSQEESDQEASSSDPEAEEEQRMGNTQWCSCKHCDHTWLKHANKCLCCQEHGKTHALAFLTDLDVSICITNNADFRIIYLMSVVLRNVLVALNNVRADHWEVNPPENKSLRYAAYCQFTWWIYGKLRPGRRRVIPACATHTIRKAFLKYPDEEYEGYHSLNSEIHTDD